MRSRSAISNSLLFVFALGFSVSLTYRVSWGKPKSYHESMRWRKVEYYDLHAGEFDVVFAGSSFVGQGIVPEVFDDVLGEYGVKVKSFNLGLPGDLAHHTEHLIRQKVLRKDGKVPKYLIIDPRLLDVRVETRPLTRRDLIWNGPYETYAALRSVMRSEKGSRQKGSLIKPHIQTFMSKYLSISKGLDHMKDTLNSGAGYPYHDDVAEMIARNRGYTPYSWHDGRDEAEFSIKRERFLPDQYSDYFERLSAYRDQQAEAVAEGAVSVNREFMKRQVERIESAGVHVVYVTLPTVMDFRPIDACSREVWFPDYLPFHSKDASGWGYDPSLRFDKWHLNDAASTEFTKRFARRFSTEVLELRQGGG